MIRILIIDDSVVFRSQISAALKDSAEIEIAGTAPNGSIGLQKLEQLSVDLVTLDMEMPDMDGIAVLKEIRRRGIRVRVIVFSSQTTRGAEKALKALEAGADDVVAKPSGDEKSDLLPTERIKEILLSKILQFSKVENRLKSKEFSTAEKVNENRVPTEPGNFDKLSVVGFLPSVIVIASSTGGPTALESIFSKLRAPFRVPVLIAQHMPPVFTQILAKRISDLSQCPCKEAENGEPLKAENIYIAPGDYHLFLQNKQNVVTLGLNQGPQRNFVRPSADYLFESAAELFGKKCFGLVLTGMGEDGLQGSLAIKRAGGRIMIQDEKSCVVFGMPGAVFRANGYDGIGDLENISAVLGQMTK